MAMIKCPECGGEISTRATNCIKCGLPMSEIFVCPECSNVMLREGKDACSNCGCPIEKNEKSPNNSVNVELQNKSEEKPVEEKSKEENDAKYVAIAEKIIRKTFASNPMSGAGIYCESGNPISDRRKVEAVKTAFNIPANDKVFFIVSGNIMGGVNERMKGFAVSSHGIFLNDDSRRRGYFFLHEFVDVKVSKSFGFLKFGNYEFNLGIDLNKIIRTMNALQEETMEYLQ